MLDQHQHAKHWRPDARWTAGPRVRIDSLRRGESFLSIQGEVHTMMRRDGAQLGVYHMQDGHMFAGSAEGVKLP